MSGTTDCVSGYYVWVEQQTGCQDIVSEWSNRLGVRILCMSGATDWVSGYYVWVEQQTGCQDIMSEWSNRLGVRILCLSGATDWLSGYYVWVEQKTGSKEYPDTQSVAPLRHNILTPSLLLHSDTISWHPVYLSEWSNRLGVRILCLTQQTGCQDIMSDIICLSGAKDWV